MQGWYPWQKASAKSLFSGLSFPDEVDQPVQRVARVARMDRIERRARATLPFGNGFLRALDGAVRPKQRQGDIDVGGLKSAAQRFRIRFPSGQGQKGRQRQYTFAK